MALTLITAPIWFWLYIYSGRLMMLVFAHFLLVLIWRIIIPSHFHIDLSIGVDAITNLKEVYWINKHNLWSDIYYYSSKQYFIKQGGTNKKLVHACYRDILKRQWPESQHETNIRLKFWSLKHENKWRFFFCE
jgi:hypothetical protein